MNVGRSTASWHLAAARAAAAEAPLLTRQALLEQAGVIATANLGEPLDAVALLASQPPRRRQGRRGVQYPRRRDARRRRVRRRRPAGRRPGRAYPAGAPGHAPRRCRGGRAGRYHRAIAPGIFRRCLEIVGADPGVNAVLALTATTATSDLVPAARDARLPVPIAAAVMDQVEAVRLLPGLGEDDPAVPAYAYPESAARALGHAVRYGTWQATPPGRVPDLDGLHQDRARELIASFLAGIPAGGWLPSDPAVELLGCYGVPLVDCMTVTTEDTAIAAAARFGGPVALKADVPGLVRRRDASAILLTLQGADEVRRGFRLLRDTFGDRLAGVIVQPMITGGVKVMISVLQEQAVGPLVLFGLGGAAAYARADRAARLAPLTDADTDDLIHSIRAAPLLLGRPGAPGADITALRDMLLRISRLADDLPQVAELHLSPVIARPDGAHAVDGRIRIQAAEPADAYLRRLQ